MKVTDKDIHFMRMALHLARKAEGRTLPNPMVGAVIVKRGSIIGQGYHKGPGKPHAEIMALRSARADVRGSTMYVTLEPCTTYGRTPPCVPEILKSGIKKVFIATEDPNPVNHKKGIMELRKNGIEVVTGLCKEEASYINRIYKKVITAEGPWVIVKVGMSMDGKIATRKGASRWITSPEARKQVIRLRDTVDAVLIGKNTLIKDNPVLRGCKRRFLRVVVASRIDFPLRNLNILRDTGDREVLFAVSPQVPYKKLRYLLKRGVRVMVIPGKDGRVDLGRLIKILYNTMGVYTVLIEGGGEIIASAFAQGMVDEFIAFIAPKVIGGIDAPTPVGGCGIEKLNDAERFRFVEVKRIGPDVMLRAVR